MSSVMLMAAAVADFTPVTVAPKKIKKQDDGLVIETKKTTDILKALGDQKKNDQRKQRDPPAFDKNIIGQRHQHRDRQSVYGGNLARGKILKIH